MEAKLRELAAVQPAEVSLVSLENIKKLHGALDFALKELDKKLAPKAKFFDAVSNGRGNVNLTVVVKILGRGPNKMVAPLRDLGILYYTRGGINVPAQRHNNAGHFVVKTAVDHPGGDPPPTPVPPSQTRRPG